MDAKFNMNMLLEKLLYMHFAQLVLYSLKFSVYRARSTFIRMQRFNTIVTVDKMSHLTTFSSHLTTFSSHVCSKQACPNFQYILYQYDDEYIFSPQFLATYFHDQQLASVPRHKNSLLCFHLQYLYITKDKKLPCSQCLPWVQCF